MKLNNDSKVVYLKNLGIIYSMNCFYETSKYKNYLNRIFCKGEVFQYSGSHPCFLTMIKVQQAVSNHEAALSIGNKYNRCTPAYYVISQLNVK